MVNTYNDDMIHPYMDKRYCHTKPKYVDMTNQAESNVTLTILG